MLQQNTNDSGGACELKEVFCFGLINPGVRDRFSSASIKAARAENRGGKITGRLLLDLSHRRQPVHVGYHRSAISG